MKKANYLFLFFLSFFFGCKRECKENTQSAYTISKTNLDAIIPYKGDEKLNFLKNGLDTVSFYGQGIKTLYQYTSTQDDCPTKIPLENKYLIFMDSVNGDNFLLQLYINSVFYTNFLIKINNSIVSSGADIIDAPRDSVNIIGVQYKNIVYLENTNYFFYYQFAQKGMIKFKSGNDIFELIP